jgi:hypothetical protein
MKKIKLSIEINEIEAKWKIQRINERKNWYFKKVLKVDLINQKKEDPN